MKTKFKGMELGDLIMDYFDIVGIFNGWMRGEKFILTFLKNTI